MPLTPQEWLAAAIVLIVAVVLLRAQWKKSAEQINASCKGCHKQTEIGKAKPAFRGVQIKVSTE